MRPSHRTRIAWMALTALAAATWAGGSAFADPEPERCRPEVPVLDKYEYLRALSLDLRGVVPSVEEYRALDDLDHVPADLIDEWLASEELGARAVRHHRSLLWPNVQNVPVLHFRRSLHIFRSSDGTPVYYRFSAGRDFRGSAIRCLDEPATYDAEGNLEYDYSSGGPREGWVQVTPYWDPTTTVKVCAYDAMEDEVSPSGRRCDATDAAYDLGCGCGPNLRWCYSDSQRRVLLRSFAGDIERRVAANVLGDEPYVELLTGRRAFVNGPLVFFWREQVQLYNQVPLVPEPLDPERLPDLPYGAADTWEEIELPEGHSGVLTSPAYLLRFQTNRARANRFHDAFLCEPFQPPPGGLPVGDEASERQPDVQQREGCEYCHAVLEPAAAHWGRWAQQSAGYLHPDEFPVLRPECEACARGFEACSDECSQHYVTRALSPEEEPYLGMLRAFRFLRPEHHDNVDSGPAALVRAGVVDHRLPACTVRRTFEWLMQRDLGPDDQGWADDTARRFLDRGLRYRDVVRAVVTSDAYRRVR